MFKKLFIKLKPLLINLVGRIEQLEQKLKLQQKVKTDVKTKFVLPDQMLAFVVILVIIFSVLIKIVLGLQIVKQEILVRIVGLVVIIYVLVSVLKYLTGKIINNAILNLEQYRKGMVICLTVLLIEIVFVLFLKMNKWNFYLLPISGLVILVALLLDIWWGIGFSIVSGLICVYLFSDESTEMFYLAVYYILTSAYVLTMVEKISSRQEILRAIAKSGLISYVIAVSLQLIGYDNITELLSFKIPTRFYSVQLTTNLLSLAMIFILNGIISLLLLNLLLVPFETIYQCTTNIKLAELSRPDHPLLHRLMTEAPGTYHHSLLVSSLAEAVATKLGLNAILCRVAGLYHDIGKLVQPEYFIENQVSMYNPHNTINLSLSALIITNHVKEGVKIAKEYKIGKVITDIIEQHHGNSIIYGLYEKTMDLFERDVMRYPGPKPQTKEAAVIMICDSCEAACRAIQEPTPQKIKETVERVINTKFLDGQFDDVPLTLRDIYIISNVIIQSLIALYHLRTHQDKDVEK